MRLKGAGQLMLSFSSCRLGPAVAAAGKGSELQPCRALPKGVEQARRGRDVPLSSMRTGAGAAPPPRSHPLSPVCTAPPQPRSSARCGQWSGTHRPR